MFSGTSLIRLRLVPLYFRSNNYENGYILTDIEKYDIFSCFECVYRLITISKDKKPDKIKKTQ